VDSYYDKKNPYPWSYQKVFLRVVSLSSALNAMTTCVLNFVFGEHAHRYVGFVLKKLQDLSSIPGNLLSLKRS
jgi:hypothetical protein